MVDYKKIAEQVFLMTDARKYMKELDQKAPDSGYRKVTIMGKEFDPDKAKAYASSFAISRS